MSTVLDRLCPFHMQVAYDGRVLHLGPSVQKILGAVGQPYFFDHFHVARPAGIFHLPHLRAFAGGKISMTLVKYPQVMVHASLVDDPTLKCFVFNLTFGIGLKSAIAKFHLTMNDFAATDLVPEILYLIEANQAAMQASKRLTKKLQGAKAIAEEQATLDTLTGLRNRRGMDAVFAHLKNSEQDFSVIQMDLDHFKAVNDTFGHAAGDAVLLHVAEVLRRETRHADFLVRLGGDEFLLILPDLTEPARLLALGHALIHGIEEPVSHQGKQCFVSASLGITSIGGPGQNWSPAQIL